MNNTFNSTTNSANNEDYINMLFPYNDHSSYPLLSFYPSSSIIPNIHHHLNHHHHHFDHHHHQQLPQPSPFSQFEFDPDLALLSSFLPQINGQDDSQTIPNYHHHHHPSSLFPLTCNFIEEQSIDQASETITHTEDSQRISISQDPRMKKLSKRSRPDKHSKIKTAKGTRDRRMRLSLDVATKLFGLQDMLGFDKASKTVEWLLTQAKPEIIKIATSLSHQLNHGGGSDCFTSDDDSQKRQALGFKDTPLCEITSFLTDDRGDNSINMTGDKIDGRSTKKKSSQPRTLILKKLSKEARAKARERAKDRTKEKMMLKRTQVNVVIEPFHDHHKILKNNKSDVNSNWSFKNLCKEIQEPYYKNDRFSICDEIAMNQDHHYISDESYDLINRLNSSFPISIYHRSHQGATTSFEQNEFMDNQRRDYIYNSQNMC